MLVVDDEPRISGLVRDYLDQAGFRVVEAADGAAALDAVRDHRPDLIILDLGLPKVDGLDVIRRVRTNSEVPIIILTATHFNTNPSRQFEKDPRIKAILKKPCETEALAKLVRSLVPVSGAGPAPAK